MNRLVFKNRISKSKINAQINFLKTMANKITIPAESLRFVLFTNKGKKEEKHPDYNGTVEVGEKGKDGKFKIVAWKQTSKDGNTNYVSGKIDFSKDLNKEESKKQTADDFLG